MQGTFFQQHQETASPSEDGLVHKTQEVLDLLQDYRLQTFYDSTDKSSWHFLQTTALTTGDLGGCCHPPPIKS